MEQINPLSHPRPSTEAAVARAKATLGVASLVFTICSTGLLVYSWQALPSAFMGLYVGQACFFWAYLAMGWASPKGARTHAHWLMALLLGLLAGFGLNRELVVLPPSSDWLTVLLALFGLAVMSYGYRERLPRWANLAASAILGACLPLMFYGAVILSPLYLPGVFGMLLLGISVHVFAPALLFWALIVAMRRYTALHRVYLWAWLGGLAAAVLGSADYVWQWKMAEHHVNQLYRQHQGQYEPELPNWVAVAQQLPRGWFAEQFLQTEVVYRFDMLGASNVLSGRRDDLARHEPLVNLATLFAAPSHSYPNRGLGEDGAWAEANQAELQLTREDRVKILEAMYDSRHQTEERLWSGDRLRTHQVLTNVRLYPKFRLAYTEKHLWIKHLGERWASQQEAVYTFQLPDGGAVTSLSLWVNGEERPGILTTKAKADSAYRTVVGVERRDPSVVHWQEGNVVSVRVFPCTAEEVRQVKLGVSAPLRHQAGQLVYDNITFRGPAADEAQEHIQLKIDDGTGVPDLPRGFAVQPGGFYTRDADYQPDWTATLPAPAPAKGTFKFGGQTYQIEPDPLALAPFAPQDLYLDLNGNWEKDELEAILVAAEEQKIKVWHWFKGQMQPLTTQTLAVAHEATEDWHFSLFPVHRVPRPASALLVTKAEAPSPNLRDLGGSPFALALAAHLKAGPAPLRTFSLSPRLNPFLRTLHEMRVLHVEAGTLEDLEQRLAKRQFGQSAENAQTVALGPSQMLVRQVAAPAAGAVPAPDHVLRLFAYHHLLKQIAPHYFKENFVTEPLLAVAAQAQVVTPLSSLIVLETQADYDRFGIKQSRDALGNATMKGEGAVPEPHEWAMIGLAALVLLLIYLRGKLSWW
jgi:hypothetical protein